MVAILFLVCCIPFDSISLWTFENESQIGIRLITIIGMIITSKFKFFLRTDSVSKLVRAFD